MNHYQNHAIDAMISGWTRIDMLLALYDRAISTIRTAEEAQAANDSSQLAVLKMEATRYLLALHSGLNTDKYEIAVDVARLLNFVMLRLEQNNFKEAVYFLKKLHASFESIREEATAMEKTGKIPPLSSSPTLNAIA